MTAEAMTEDRLDVKYERWDALDPDYRAGVVKIASFQVLAELIGVLPFADWLSRAPSLTRKHMLMAKVQDEVGHGHVCARVAEDLGGDRIKVFTDFVEGKTKVLNIFHYDFESWEEIGPAALLMNSAAITQFQSLGEGTYLPYARALKKIEREESFHFHHAIDMSHETMTVGTTAQRRLAQRSFEEWLPRVLAYFGPSDAEKIKTNPLYLMGLKVDSNHDLRHRWLTKVIPAVRRTGVEVDPDLVRPAEESGTWVFPEPDWAEVKRVIDGGGPASARRVDQIRSALDKNSRYRDAAYAAAA